MKKITPRISLLSKIGCTILGISLTSCQINPTISTSLINSSVISSSNATSSTTSTTSSISSSSIDNVSSYQIVNGDFETGDLRGWTILEGSAFSDSGLSAEETFKTSSNQTINYGKQGKYFFLHTLESDVGQIRSSEFIIGGSGYITFKLGAGYQTGLTYLSIVKADDAKELFRFGNSAFNRPSDSSKDQYRVENLVEYYANLSAYKGTSVYIKLTDNSTANYGYLSVDNIVTYYPTIPLFENRYPAINIVPIFNDTASIPKVLYNGNFNEKNLSGWSVIGEANSFLSSHINSSGKLSNRPNETSIGILRSSAFKVGGKNLISFRLGATKHADLTYMSLRLVGTNQEIFRTYSNRWKESDEEATHLYFIDLTRYSNHDVYFEFVDNSRGDWGLLTIEAITTYYDYYPSITDEIAVNLLTTHLLKPTYQVMRNLVNPLINGISDQTTRFILQKTFYATIDGIQNNKGNWPSVLRYNQDGTTFVYTGDIAAMWLRDSSAQVLPYLAFMKVDEDVRLMVHGLLRKQFELIRRDPYANAFNADGSVFERKFEIDSLIYPLWLAHQYYQITGDASLFDQFFVITMNRILTTLENERHHSDSNYRITNQADRDSAPHEVNLNSGLIWSGYRPSDDVTYYKYFIPGNMFAVATLEKIALIMTQLNLDVDITNRAITLAQGVRQSIETYATYQHPKYGKIYAFEVNGMSNDVNSSNGKLLMDAANIPSLLAIPWLGYASVDDTTYQNTRRFILSLDNPYYYQGTYASGIGDPHDSISGLPNPHPEVPVPWHMAIAMQGLTSNSESEIQTMLNYMINTTGGTYVMHEAFNANNPNDYSRDYFTWPCALFAEFYLTRVLKYSIS